MTGEETWLVVAVPKDDGTILASVDETTIAVQPDQVEKIRTVLTEARSVALQDRGRW